LKTQEQQPAALMVKLLLELFCLTNLQHLYICEPPHSLDKNLSFEPTYPM